MNQPSTVVALPSERTATALSQATAVEQARAIAEVQAAVVVAQQCPRDMARAEGEMRDACGRSALAARAFYRVPNRGSGPSVHLARELARIWGNVDYGVRELRRDDLAGESEILAYAWDVQTNTRSTRTFVVPHQRMKAGKRTDLTDLGDVYLNNQNVGARAVRECVFTVLPVWFVETAQELCHATLQNGEGVPLPQRIDDMVAAFHAQFGVKSAQIEDKLGRKRGQWDAGDVATMQITYGSLARGEVTVDDEFPSARTTIDDVTGAAPADPEPPDETGEALTDHTRKTMHALFRDLGLTTKAQQMPGIIDVIGRHIDSRTELTEAEGVAVNDALRTLNRTQDIAAVQAGEPA